VFNVAPGLNQSEASQYSRSAFDNQMTLKIQFFSRPGLINPVELLNLHHLCFSFQRRPQEVTNTLSVIIIPPTTVLKIVTGNPQLMTTQDTNVLLDELASSFSTMFLSFGTGCGFIIPQAKRFLVCKVAA
jgi:hypothetical protein